MDKERELFERWACEDVNDAELRRLICLRRGAFGEYEIDSMEDKWEAWQARANLNQWQSIDDAKLGEWVLVVDFDGDCYTAAKKETFYGSGECFFESIEGSAINAKAFMPLPEPPK